MMLLGILVAIGSRPWEIGSHRRRCGASGKIGMRDTNA